MATGGQAGIRGYLVQTLFGLLDALDRDDWTSVTFEPSDAHEKADIVWSSSVGTRAVQVKHSSHPIAVGEARTWAEALKANVSAVTYELWLAGPTSRELAKGMSHDGVVIPPPEPASLRAFVERSAHRLDKLLAQAGISNVPAFAREVVVGALSARLAEASAHGTELTRTAFVDLVLTWVRTLYPSAVNDAAERLRKELELRASDRIAGARFRLKHDACLEALAVVDLLYAKAFGVDREDDTTDSRNVWARARACHNQLVVACDGREVIRAFRLAVGMSGPHSAASVVQLREAIRRELGFGEESVDDDPQDAWIVAAGFKFNVSDEQRAGINRMETLLARTPR